MSQPKEHPILFSAEMVRAVLSDRKTVTRRLSKQWLKVKAGDRLWVRETFTLQCDCDGDKPPFSDGRPIQHVEEAGWLQPHYRATDPAPELSCERVNCGAPDPSGPHCHWKPSIHMPRWASRITLEATEDARDERLTEISGDEVMREGCTLAWGDRQTLGSDEEAARRNLFRQLWGDLHPKPGERWEDNPTVVRLAFRRLA